MRTVGVEEEFLIVDEVNGQALPLAQALQGSGVGGGLVSEMKQEQIEVCTRPHLSLEDLAAEVGACRAAADFAARALGARTAAVAMSPLPVRSRVSPGLRYQAMMDRFALTAREQLTCGCHVHVAVVSDEEGVAVLDRIRIWLPVLAALSANSPFWNGEDTGYASFRSQAWNRWPLAGPCDIFGTAENYHQCVRDHLLTGVPLDLGQIYFDARLSHNHPTVEVRIGDVCLHPDDTVLLAALIRALVETAARQWRAGEPPLPVPTAQLRLAAWRAGRSGMDGDLLHPVRNEPMEAASVISALLAEVRPVLKEQGEAVLVESLVRQVLARGTGARRQRAVYRQNGDLRDVVADSVFVSNLQLGSLSRRHEMPHRLSLPRS
ncbi:MAG: putative enzyme [Micrococcaceae bacterium]|jgi:carboxylate-amine ligase|nr:putative enzyme [Micrococcaceae bacterium]